MTRENVLKTQRQLMSDGVANLSSQLTADDAEKIARVQAMCCAPTPNIHQRMIEIGEKHMVGSKELLKTLDPDLAKHPTAIACFASICVMTSLSHYAGEDLSSGGMPPGAR